MERPKMENKVKLVVVKDKYSLIFQNSSGTSKHKYCGAYVMHYVKSIRFKIHVKFWLIPV